MNKPKPEDFVKDIKVDGYHPKNPLKSLFNKATVKQQESTPVKDKEDIKHG